MRIIIAFITTFLLVTLPLHADWQPGYASVDSFSGNVRMDGQTGNLVKHQAFAPDGVSLTTGRNSFLSLVFSNGMSIHMGASSELRVLEFAQQPWQAGENNPDFEPSRSRIKIQLVQGDFAITQRQAFPTSEIVFVVPQGTIETLSPAIYINLQATESALFVLEGRALFHPRSHARRDFVQSGQILDLDHARQGVGGLAINRISYGQNNTIQELLTRSRSAAARTVFIKEGDTLQARAVRPARFFDRRAVYDPMIR